MIDVHLIGYTADLEHLVLDLDGEPNGRYRLVVDADLLATLAEIRARSAEEGRDWPGDDLVTWSEEDEVDETEDRDDEELEADPPVQEPQAPSSADSPLFDEDDEDDEAWEAAQSAAEAALDATGTDEAQGRAAEAASRPGPTPEPERQLRADAPLPRHAPPPAPAAQAEDKPEPQLSPAQIQAMLRSGKSAQVVAKAAGTDVAWIERWLPPILEERARVLREARSMKLKRPRLGTSRAPLGDAVARALADRNVPGEDISWETSRRNDGRWRVSVKYRHRNRNRTASWTYDPREGEIEPASDLAKDLGFRGPKRKKKPAAASRATTKPASRTGSAATREPASGDDEDVPPADVASSDGKVGRGESASADAS